MVLYSTLLSSLSLTDLALGVAPRCLCWRFIGLTYLYLLFFSFLFFSFPVSSCSSFLIFWYLAFLAIDWSRTVSASLPFVFVSFVCPLPLLIFHLSSADLCFRRVPFHFDLVCLFSVLVFLRTSVGGASPFTVSFAPAPLPPLFVSVSSLGCLFPPPSPTPLLALRFPLRFPRVLCLVLLAVDWSRISSTALISPLSLVCCAALLLPLFPFGTPSTSVPVWYFWPQTGQRYHSAGPPKPFQPGTVSGRRLVQGLLP